jgi:threonine dehydrogenase-like Zn-dependent dehydrogenase
MLETSRFGEAAAKPGTIRAARLVAPRRFEIVDVAVPEPGPGQVRVRLEGCGVCASNIPPYEGREWFNYPMEPGALGHEGWGHVEAVGEGVTAFEVGQRIACLSQHAYAEADVVDVDSCVALPDGLEGKPFPGEPLGCAVNIYRRSGVRPGDTVAIVGIGFLGALLTQMAAQDGARVIAIARRPYALEVARQMGASETILMDDHWRILSEVRDLTGGRWADVAIECVGKQWPLDLSGELIREMGRLIVAGYHQDGLRQVNMQMWNWKGLDVINAHEREQRVYIEGIREAATRANDGRLDPYPLFTHHYGLEGLGQALEDTIARPDGFMKALVTFEGRK